MLARVLQFPEFNEEDDLKTAILIDVYYEMLSYLVNNGFPWQEIASFFEIFKSLLNKTQGKDYARSGKYAKNIYIVDVRHERTYLSRILQTCRPSRKSVLFFPV